MPKVFRTNMRFGESWSETTAGGFVSYTFLGNSIWDPDTAAGGNSAIGTDTMAYIYNTYKVLSSAIHIDAVNNNASTPLRVVVYPAASGGPLASAQKEGLMGLPGAKYAIICNQTGQGHLSNYCTTASIKNVKDVDDIGFTSSLSNSPAHVWYWHLYLWHEGITDLSAEVNVTITFTVDLSDFNFDSMGI